MIVDTSVLLSVLFAEPTSDACLRSLQAAGGPVLISPLVWVEVRTIVTSRRPESRGELEATLSRLPLRVSFLGERVYTPMVAARLEYDLTLSECSTYALAKTMGRSLLTLNPKFRQTDAELIYPGE